jgi:hypothetical protein
MSAPWAPWPPPCTVIEETGWTFFTHARDVRSNSVNSRDARAWSLQDVRSCQCQSILAEDGVTTQRIRASSLTSWLAKRFLSDLRGKLDFGPPYFRGMYLSRLNSFGTGFFSKPFFVLFVSSECNYCLSSSFVPPTFKPSELFE